MKTHTLDVGDADIVYDIEGDLPTPDERRPLLMIGQPMDASGFRALASYFPDRVVVTYDPRGIARSTRRDGRVDSSPTVQAQDLHALVGVLGAGPVDVFASSGGAVTALAWVAGHPDDVAVLVAHEPPLAGVLTDAESAEQAMKVFRDAYNAGGFGAGMAAFIAMTSWRGDFTEEFLAAPPPDPAMFALPTADDGSRDDPLLSDRSRPVTDYRPDFVALKAASTRLVLGFGEESEGLFTGRAAVAVAERLGQTAVVFPSHHGGFSAEDSGYPGQPEAFAKVLRAALES
ncbi:MAG TPA: alpha/beta hydrolase [Galbitalea sp.]|jgi:pimeloyl-ACP methyl ester carboxylesterase|nr:alpha/beta hydrolase [Galbitalea sp.]